MRMMTSNHMQSKEEMIQRMKKELEAYKADNSTAKPYFTLMKELSAYLKTKENS